MVESSHSNEMSVQVTTLLFFTTKTKKSICNPGIEKDKEKVVHFSKLKDLEDLVAKDGKVAYCRCWVSQAGDNLDR